MTDLGEFWIRFWGVRGSIPCPGPETKIYGGNTACIEVRCGEHLFILDGGSGMRTLGQQLMNAEMFNADIFYTHTHLDHVIGFPFFVPFFNPKNKFRLWAGHLLPSYTLRGVLEMMLTAPLFPVPLDIVQAELTFKDFPAGQTLEPRAGVIVRTCRLNHPNNATGYRFEYAGKSLCYITDTEHTPGRPDQEILALIDKADVMIYDATYTDDEFERYKGWGHSTWQEGLRLADAAGVGKYVVYHHDPGHDDAFMAKVQADVEAARPGRAVVAREGMSLILA